MLELDQELFFPIASQLGEDNEVVRNLLIDAEHKITELDSIKQSLGRLVDPVSKTLRAFEEAKNEKLSLQGVLNNTRIAYSKLREDLTTAEKQRRDARHRMHPAARGAHRRAADAAARSKPPRPSSPPS